MTERRKCDVCNERPATITVTRIVGGDRTDLHVCSECAEKQGLGSGTDQPESLPVLLARSALARISEMRLEVPDIACEACGLTYRKFVETSLLGCAKCYDHFADELAKLLEHTQGETTHRGKHPGGGGSLDVLDREQKLRDELSQAVAAEDFERAAKLRDDLASLGGGDV